MVNRNVRNNNPGNIEKGTLWDGLAAKQPDPRFASFESPAYGFRAMAKILITYKRKYGPDTVEGIVTRWAPPVENDTQAYIEFVQKAARMKAFQTVENFDIPAVIAAMAQFEGWGSYDLCQAKQGYHLV